MERKLAEVFHVSEFITDELRERGWSIQYLAVAMGGDAAVNELSIELLKTKDVGVLLGEETARQLGQAFDVSPQYFLNLDNAWRENQPTTDKQEEG